MTLVARSETRLRFSRRQTYLSAAGKLDVARWTSGPRASTTYLVFSGKCVGSFGVVVPPTLQVSDYTQPIACREYAESAVILQMHSEIGHRLLARRGVTAINPAVTPAAQENRPEPRFARWGLLRTHNVSDAIFAVEHCEAVAIINL